jgi:hypothetical protein
VLCCGCIYNLGWVVIAACSRQPHQRGSYGLIDPAGHDLAGLAARTILDRVDQFASRGIVLIILLLSGLSLGV